MPFPMKVIRLGFCLKRRVLEVRMNGFDVRLELRHLIYIQLLCPSIMSQLMSLGLNSIKHEDRPKLERTSEIFWLH
jgi:hypothetical protein